MGEAVQLEIFGVSAVEPPWRDNKDAMEYGRMVGHEETGFAAGNEGPGQDAGPSPGAGLDVPGPRPPR